MHLHEFATAIVENASSCFLESFEGLSSEHVWAQIAPETNPIAWITGHCACHLDALQSRVSGGPRLLDDLRALFRPGNRISDVLPDLPPFADTVDGFLRARDAVLTALNNATPNQLLGTPEGVAAPHESPLEQSKRVALHLALHLGHVLLIRKFLGMTSPRGFFPGLKPQHRRDALQRWNQWWQASKNLFDLNPYAQPTKGNSR